MTPPISPRRWPDTPFRKPPGGELLDWQKEFNTAIIKIRYVIERAIVNFKTWRCMLTDYRRPLRTNTTVFRAVRALHFFKLLLHEPPCPVEIPPVGSMRPYPTPD